VIPFNLFEPGKYVDLSSEGSVNHDFGLVHKFVQGLDRQMLDSKVSWFFNNV
jgi:hypothetical protein